jgi:triphosphoribosyl-dephospho-CoA synthase
MQTIGLSAQLACIWEATARKPGNVHRYCDFPDVGHVDFLTSAAAIAPILQTASRRPIGATILKAIEATRQVVSTNTNLGIVLLLAPLAAVPHGANLREALDDLLGQLTHQDAIAVYRAIRLANPGGLGKVPNQDVATEPTLSLREVMTLAADRDLIARQYANGFRQVLDDGVPALAVGLDQTGKLENAIVYCHLHLLATYPDSLIIRKRGAEEAEKARQLAQRVLSAGWPASQTGQRAFVDLDAWLRSQGTSRNPGTTADLVTACLFVLLRTGKIAVPLRIPWQAGPEHD